GTFYFRAVPIDIAVFFDDNRDTVHSHCAALRGLPCAFTVGESDEIMYELRIYERWFSHFIKRHTGEEFEAVFPKDQLTFVPTLVFGGLLAILTAPGPWKIRICSDDRPWLTDGTTDTISLGPQPAQLH